MVDEKIFCIHAGLSPDLNTPDQIKRIMRPTDVPDSGLLCDLLWSDPECVTASVPRNRPILRHSTLAYRYPGFALVGPTLLAGPRTTAASRTLSVPMSSRSSCRNTTST